MTQTTTDTDILIAGGGMVGAALAVALRDTGLRVTLVEAVAPRGPGQPSYDDRSIAVAYSSRRILDTLDVWRELESSACPIERVHVSQQRRLGVTRLSADEENLPALGYVVPNRALGNALMGMLEQAPHLELLTPATVTAVRVEEPQVRVAIESAGGEQEVSARLLVIADGARSPLRDMLGIGARQWDYGQTAIVCNVSMELPHQNTAYERFTPHGPMALLPLDRERMALVLVEDSVNADGVMALSSDAFMERVQARFGTRLGAIIQAGSRSAYPLALVTATRQTSGRAVILGNAAHSLHPIAGQGFNLSLRDVAVLAEVIVDSVAANAGDPGAPHALDDYLRWRRRDQRNVVVFTDVLNRLFGIPFGVAARARGLGLLGMDLLPALRREFSRHAMGRAGRLPRLARGVPLR